MSFELLKIAWKNVWRYPRRSILTASLVSFACICLILISGLSDGVNQQMIEQSTRSFAGSFKIYHEKFKEEWDSRYTIDSPHQLEAILLKEPAIEAFSPRLVQLAMLSTSYDSSSIQLYGIDLIKK